MKFLKNFDNSLEVMKIKYQNIYILKLHYTFLSPIEKGVDIMRLTVTGRNITLTDALKDVVEKKLSKLDKYFVPEVDTRVTLSVQKNRQIIEVTIPWNGMIVRGEESTDDMYASIENVVEKIEKQILKNKTRFERKLHEGSVRLKDIPLYDFSEEDDSKIVKTKKFPIKPMDAEEAVLQMDLLGHSFFVFKNADSNEVNVVYKRKDGNYGLIEPEFQKKDGLGHLFNCEL